MVFNYTRFDAKALLDQIVRCGVSTFCAPPTVWRMLIQEDLGRWSVPLREALSAGEPLNPEVIEQVRRKWGITVRDGYGQTETTAQIGNSPGQPVKPGSMGRPLPGYRARAARPARPASPPTRGRSPSTSRGRPLGLMTGYRGGAEDAASATGGAYLPHGRRRLARRRRLHHLRRARGRSLQGVGLPDLAVRARERADGARGGRRGGGRARRPTRCASRVPKAYVTLAPGHEPTRETALAIMRFARERLAPYKRIRRLEFAELPKTISGKIRRVELRDDETCAPTRTRPSAERWSSGRRTSPSSSAEPPGRHQGRRRRCWPPASR